MPHRPVLLVPDASWFAGPAVIDSIHGARHNARVSLLVQLLARHHGLDHDSALALAAAAACHDCHRHHDRDDRGHGRRAAGWRASPSPSPEATTFSWKASSAPSGTTL
ncbi:hypothetical protein [Kitasatospora sp. NPDC092286]|uniref:hypothetical protein n=1 Tax=Kitasatospora sp. NPDC092286 TaxID=3364087 RepID=UPI00382BDA35